MDRCMRFGRGAMDKDILCSWAVKGARASKRAQSPKLHHQLSAYLFEEEVVVDCAVDIANVAARHLDVARNPKFRWLQGCLGTLEPHVVSLIVIAHQRDMSLRQITKQSIFGRLFSISYRNIRERNPGFFQSPCDSFRTIMSTNNNHDLSAEQPRDAITAEEINGTETPNEPQATMDAGPQKRPNACTFLSYSTQITEQLQLTTQSQNLCRNPSDQNHLQVA